MPRAESGLAFPPAYQGQHKGYLHHAPHPHHSPRAMATAPTPRPPGVIRLTPLPPTSCFNVQSPLRAHPVCDPYLFTVLNHLALWDLGASHLLPPPLHCSVQELFHLPLREHAGAPQQLVFILIDCGRGWELAVTMATHTRGARAGASAPPNG